MIAIEVIVGILIVIVAIAGIMKVAAPIADAFSDRLKLKFQEIGPEQERMFRQRIEALEQQVRDLQLQSANLQDGLNFVTNFDRTEKNDRLSDKIKISK
jgi:hypothetical protein